MSENKDSIHEGPIQPESENVHPGSAPSRHTPGPWRVGEQCWNTDVFDSDGFRVAKCEHVGMAEAFCYGNLGDRHWANTDGSHIGRSEVEQIANAAFIVRAVNAHDDILAALKRCENFLEDIAPNAPDTRLRVAIRAAIAKATSSDPR